jgi:hypothetical protein
MPNDDVSQPKNQFSQQLAQLYQRWTLDIIPSLGYAVSLDFSHRPELYKDIKNTTAKNLTNIQSQYGYAPDFPNRDIRLMLLKPIFGLSDGHRNGNDNVSAFKKARMPVLTAAAGFAENAQPTAFPMHRERIRSAIVPLRRYMEDLEGASFEQTSLRVSKLFDTAAAILRAAEVARVFGINGTIDNDWPLKSTNSEGAKLVEKMTTQLPDMPHGIIARDSFVSMQRLAEKGYQSISMILDNDIDSDNDLLDALTAQLYAWGSELRLIGGVLPQ